MNTKSVLIAASLGTLILGSLSFAAVNSAKKSPADMEAVHAAVESGSYATLPEMAKTKITEEQFNIMVAKQTEHKAVEDAIAARDYTAFKNAMIAQIPTETEFQKMVEGRKSMEATKAAIETAVKNNDFTAFKASIEAGRAHMETKRPEGTPEFEPKAVDDSKLQSHFNELVEYYKTNGKLPEMGKGFKFGPGMGGMKGHSGRRGGKL